MRFLVVDDDFTSRRLLQLILSSYGECNIAIDGEEAVDATRHALEEGEPFALICLDIMMPKINGHDALCAIREMERERGIEGEDKVKVLMTTVLDDSKNKQRAFDAGCEGYIVKPISQEEIIQKLQELFGDK